MSYLTEVLADTPRHYWRCADPGGAFLLDIGSAPDHLIFNTASEVYTPYLGPVSNGGSASVGLGYFWDNQGLTESLPLTLELWLWMHSVQGFTTVPAVLTGPSATVLQIGVLSSGVVQLNGPTGNIGSGTVPARQAWHHIVGTIAAGGAGQLYVDAILKASGALGNFVGGNTTFAVGGVTGASNNRFQGNLAEVAVYPSVLSDSRISAHFLAADATAQKPVFRAVGGVGSGTGLTTLNSDELATILASVRRTFPTT